VFDLNQDIDRSRFPRGSIHSERNTMKQFTQRKGTRARWVPRLAGSVAVTAIAAAGALGVAVGQAKAAQPVRAHLAHGVLTIEGSKTSDEIAIRLDAGVPNVLQVDVGDDGSADSSFDRSKIAAITVHGGDGDDLIRIDESNGAFTDTIPTTIDGGQGNDSLAGGSGAETLLGGGGNDSIDGNGGNDVAFMGAGDDTFAWDPGDGSDVVEGQDGADTMTFNGSDAGERVALSANGNRLTFLRSPGIITMDTAGVERVDFNALGGADQVFIDDLSGTDVKTVDMDLAGVLGGSSGDRQNDQVIVEGTNGNDAIDVSGDASGVAVAGLSARVAIQHQEPNDEIDVDGFVGNDVIGASGLAAGTVTLALDGGAGDDTIAGGQGVETLRGGDGNDSIDGNGGNDAAFMGAGDDTFVWDPGDGSDVVEGQDGADTMTFNGAGGAEQVDLSANGNRLRFFRTQGAIVMDTAGVERVDFNALGGADTVTVNDLTGTDVERVNVDLAGTLGGATGDNAADRIVLNGTNGDDTVTVSGDAGAVNVKGLVPTIGILHSEVANDRLEINTFSGIDTLDTVGLAAGAIQLNFDGVLIP